jgi:TRAP-type mannitol/chloroaromatic compound transport system permease small subunit
MKPLLAFAKLVDKINERFGKVAGYAVLLACLISAGNAFIRYAFDKSSNGWLEIQWYLFAFCVMFGASEVLKLNEHVRVDIFYGNMSAKRKVFTDLFGLIFFLLPVVIVMFYFSWPHFLKAFHSGEMSSNAGGLIRWPFLFCIPAGFAMLFIQGLAEIIKRVAWLRGEYEMTAQYERPLQ